MVVRIRFAKPPSPFERRIRNQRLALVLSTLLHPTAVAALALALWRIFAGFQLVASFAFDTGLLSHWQTWLAVAAAIWYCSSMLNRYGKDGGPAAV
jgi:hypothetical protein